MKPLYIFDLDGTLADIRHRLHFIQNGNPDWKAFFQACDKDEPVEWTIRLMNLVYDAAHDGYVLILTGRSERVRDKTELWLERHGARYHELIMRPVDDYRPDDELKLELLNIFLRDHPQHSVVFIVDDRQRVVDMWRREGYNVLQCDAWPENEFVDLTQSN